MHRNFDRPISSVRLIRVRAVDWLTALLGFCCYSKRVITALLSKHSVVVYSTVAPDPYPTRLRHVPTLPSPPSPPTQTPLLLFRSFSPNMGVASRVVLLPSMTHPLPPESKSTVALSPPPATA